ncbi:MAG: DUF4405 domain-containing protein [Pseudobdellovibrio sp.]
MKITKEWATPLTAGAFTVMSVTGLLMFFDAETGYNKPAHEWVGLVMVAAVVFHTIVNWKSLKNHFVNNKIGRALMIFGAVFLLMSFYQGPKEGNKKAGPNQLVMEQVLKSPIAKVAVFIDKPVDEIMSKLKAQGLNVTDSNQSLQQITNENRELQFKALRAIFER